MSQESGNDSSNLFIYILLAGVLIVIIASFYSFYFEKNYDFFVETECNPEMETCFFRDCENEPDICPPNNLSYYNQYTIKANDFKVCKNEDCKEACGLGLIQCIKTECSDGDIAEGVCLLPFSTTEDEELINLDLEN
jgi:hypothetical protein